MTSTELKPQIEAAKKELLAIRIKHAEALHAFELVPEEVEAEYKVRELEKAFSAAQSAEMDAEVARILASRKAAKNSGSTCSRCGGPVADGSGFCGEC